MIESMLNREPEGVHEGFKWRELTVRAIIVGIDRLYLSLHIVVNIVDRMTPKTRQIDYGHPE